MKLNEAEDAELNYFFNVLLNGCLHNVSTIKTGLLTINIMLGILSDLTSRPCMIRTCATSEIKESRGLKDFDL